jgi:hypothetical protein
MGALIMASDLYHHIHRNKLSKSVTCDGCAEMFDESEIDFTHADYFRCEDCAEKHSEEGYRLYWGKPSKDYQQKLSDNGGHNDR